MQLLDQAQLAASFRFPQSTALLSLRPIRQSVSTQVLEADPFDLRAGDEWDRSLAAAPDAHIFQTSAWANVLIETYGHVAVFRRYTAGGKIIALFPLMEVASRFSARRGVSVPFSDLGGPAVLQSKPGLHTALIDDLIGLARDRHWKFIELRGELPGRETLPPYQTVWAHALNLSQSTEALFENCGSAFRRGVRKAEASGVTTEISISLDAFALFTGSRIAPAAATAFHRSHTRSSQTSSATFWSVASATSCLPVAPGARFRRHVLLLQRQRPFQVWRL